MRGALRIQVVAILALAGAVTGALLGLASGAAWAAARLPDATPDLAWAATLLAAGLDACVLTVRHPRPPSVQRQVPVEWGRLLPPRTTAVLYGARLGVGPLTILRTWTWWAAFVVGAASGPWFGAVVGATFAVTRALTMEVAVRRVRDGLTMSRRMTSLRAAERRVAWVTVLVAVLVPIAACSDDAEQDEARQRPASTSTTTDATIALEPETTTTTTPEEGTLQSLLIDEALDGFLPAGVEVLDLEAAADAEVDPEAERALLETRRFQRGVARRFVNEDDDVVYVAAYEFATPRDADAYLADGVETLSARGATTFDAEVEGAFGFTTREPGFTAHGIAFTRGTRWLLVLVGSDTGSLTVEEVTQLAVRQEASVPAG